MLRILGAGPDSELAKTLDRFSDQKDRLKKQLGAFIQWKNQYPVNGSIPGRAPGFGNNDKKFISGGNFDNRMPNIAHAHLTHNLSIVYYVDRETNTLRLYGVYSHDDIGTGNPPNINRQQQMATRWTNMKFDASVPPSALQSGEKKAQPTAPVSGGKVDYTPKQKPVVQPKPQPVAPPSQILNIAKELDNIWPQRNIFAKFKQAKTPTEQLGIINSEVAYLNIIKQKHSLHPNQQDYLRGLEAVYRYITSQRR
jgi:hypothetical protein